MRFAFADNKLNVTFDRAMITAQLELNEDTLWGKHHQRWLENDLISLKSDVFISSVERRPYQGSNYAFCARWGKGHVKKLYTEEKGAHKYPAGVVDAFFDVMAIIANAPDERDLHNLKSLHYEKLRGERNHQRSLRLNRQFRLIIEKDEDKRGRFLWIISIEDYH